MKTLRITEMLLLVLFTGMIAKLCEMVKSQVPVGYQDENGFHLGEK